MSEQPTSRERLLFITGRLAEPAVRDTVGALSGRLGIEADVAVLGVSVAALLTTGLVGRRLSVERRYDRAILPGWCGGDLAALQSQFGFPFVRGPKDIADLESWMTGAEREPPDLSNYDIEIIAEINHVPRLADSHVLRLADALRADGADVIDLGCEPGVVWSRAGEVVSALKREGHRVSIDSFERTEVEAAVAAGAELVLSCNATNREWAAELPAELVAIPDDPRDLNSLEATIDYLKDHDAAFRIDPILEPIGFGFSASLARYFEARRRWPEHAVMMGIGNVTELTGVDSSGINTLLAGVCQEVGIGSILTTQVINWCRSAVHEFDISRRIMRHAVSNGVTPKHFDDRLVILRDPSVPLRGRDALQAMQAAIGDPNFRLFAEDGELHLLNRDGYWHGTDPFEVFDRALAASGPVDAQHAFYLGYEFSKAMTALTLGKRYVQDESLRWGFLSRPETSAVERRHRRASPVE